MCVCGLWVVGVCKRDTKSEWAKWWQGARAIGGLVLTCKFSAANFSGSSSKRARPSFPYLLITLLLLFHSCSSFLCFYSSFSTFFSAFSFLVLSCFNCLSLPFLSDPFFTLPHSLLLPSFRCSFIDIPSLFHDNQQQPLTLARPHRNHQHAYAMPRADHTPQVDSTTDSASDWTSPTIANSKDAAFRTPTLLYLNPSPFSLLPHLFLFHYHSFLLPLSSHFYFSIPTLYPSSPCPKP